MSRDEVSALAHISVEWYTRIEQGRVEQVSDETIDRVAAALRLNPAERDYLRDLLAQPHRPSSAPLHASLTATLASEFPTPMIVSTRYLTPIAWNRAAAEMFEIPAEGSVRERNSFVRLVVDPRHMGLQAHLEELTRLAAAAVRRALAYLGPSEEFDEMGIRKMLLIWS